MKDFYIGLLLAFSSSFFIGSSFILKKKALLKSAANNQIRAGQGGHRYLRNWLWWIGVAIMASGEACNFAAFAFAPASVITSLGAMSVLVTAVLSSYVLKEKLNLLGKIGCALCLLGATVIVLHAPQNSNITSMIELGAKMQSYGFIIYIAIALLVTAFLAFYLAPRHGQKNIFIFLAVCSIIGSITVLGCKGLGLAFKEKLNGGGTIVGLLSTPLVWILLVVVVVCITVQLNYLNKALDIYNISMVTSIYYVGFTSCVIVASSILYQEWRLLSAKDILGALCGFMTTIIGVFQMQSFNNLNISLSHLRKSIYKAADIEMERQDIGEGAGILRTHTRRRSLVQPSCSEPLLLNGQNVWADVVLPISVHSTVDIEGSGDKDDARSVSI